MDYDNIFENALSMADEAIIGVFGNCDICVEGHDSIRGIFDRPMELAEVPGGGFIENYDAEVCVRTSQAKHLFKNTVVDIHLSDGSVQKYFVIQPYPDGSGMTKITLGVNNNAATLRDKQSAGASFRHRY